MFDPRRFFPSIFAVRCWLERGISILESRRVRAHAGIHWAQKTSNGITSGVLFERTRRRLTEQTERRFNCLFFNKSAWSSKRRKQELQRALGDIPKTIDYMERETGIEPATFSLGR
jgi:hypothetical protein